MTHRQKQGLTVSSIVAGATIVISALGMLANGVIELDQKSKITAQTSATNIVLINNLILRSNRLEARVERLEGRRLRHRAVVDTIAYTPQEQPGLVRRIFKLLF